MHKPEVGQKLFSLNIGNAARGRQQILTPCVVTKVGRKYFTVCNEDDARGWSSKQYHIEGWARKSDYGDSKLYETRQAWEDEEEKVMLSRKIAEAFKYGINKCDLPLESLRKIDVIISR